VFLARSSRAARMLDEQVSTRPGTLPHLEVGEIHSPGGGVKKRSAPSAPTGLRVTRATAQEE
jgi:hypothetical protein